MDYLEAVGECYPHQDFELFMKESGFIVHQDYVFLMAGNFRDAHELPESDGYDLFVDTLDYLLRDDFNLWWRNRLSAKFSNQELVKLFENIMFGENEPAGGVDYYFRVDEFFGS